MLVFHSSTKEKRFVKTKSTKFIKITVSSLVIASLLFLGIISQLVPASTDSITADTPSLYRSVSITPSFSSVANGNNQTGSARIEAVPLMYTSVGKLVDERELIEFALSATDVDGDWLVFAASNLPDGASFDPNTQTFSWTPRYDQAGVYSVHFEVSDGQLTDSEDITVTVVQLYEDWDVNGDGTANVLDMVLVGQHWDETGLAGWIREDANEDGTINVLDIIVIGQHWTG
jgi:hypothetical protein